MPPSLSPPPRFVLETRSCDPHMSHWVHAPRLSEAETGRILFDLFDTSWSLVESAWESPMIVRMHLRCSPGDREPFKHPIEIDCERETARLTPDGLLIPLRDLPRALAALSSLPIVPIIDVSPLFRSDASVSSVSLVCEQILDAASDWGMFQVVGHDVSPSLQSDLMRASRSFFDLPIASKSAISVAHGGLAWRGYMPMGGEATHGRIDRKEGLYLGNDLAADHPRVRAKTPLFGPNQWPTAEVPHMKPAVSEYITAAARVGHAVMRSMSIALGEPAHAFHDRLHLDEPILLFRLWNYPPSISVAPTAVAVDGESIRAVDRIDGAAASSSSVEWGIDSHSDFGFLTILLQDSLGGLQVHHPRHGWVDVTPVTGALVVNVGDMLDRITGGLLKSRHHRVKATGSEATVSRLSCPLFFDAGWDTPIVPLDLDAVTQHASSRVRDLIRVRAQSPDAVAESTSRWSRTSIRSLEGTYAQYLAKKVAKVFPSLAIDTELFTPAKAHSARFQLAIHTK
jgi:isopenicillin N synthase-like dioxygenase